MCLSVVSEVEPYAVRIARTVPGGARTARCAPTRQCDQLAADLWDSNPLLAKEKQLTKLMVLLSGTALNCVRTSFHQSVRQVVCRKVGSPLKDWVAE